MSDDSISAILSFRDERDWGKFHDPKDLAISISLESSELLELFQWNTSEEAEKKSRDRMKEELADILIYSVSFADIMGFDLDEIIQNKLKKNAEKYPVELSKGSKTKYTELKGSV